MAIFAEVTENEGINERHLCDNATTAIATIALAKTAAVKTAAVQTRSLGAPLPLRFNWAWHLVFTVVRYDCLLVLKSIIQRDLLSKSCRRTVITRMKRKPVRVQFTRSSSDKIKI